MAGLIGTPLGMRGENQLSAGGFKNLRGGKESGAQMRAVKPRQLIVGNGISFRVDANAPAIPIANQDANANRVRELLKKLSIVPRIAPWQHGNLNGRLES